MKIVSRRLLLAAALTTVGCAHAIARYDFFQRSDTRIDRIVATARRTCREEQPKQALPSANQYERCVLEELRRGGELPPT